MLEPHGDPRTQEVDDDTVMMLRQPEKTCQQIRNTFDKLTCPHVCITDATAEVARPYLEAIYVHRYRKLGAHSVCLPYSAIRSLCFQRVHTNTSSIARGRVRWNNRHEG